MMHNIRESKNVPCWMPLVLYAAAVYNATWMLILLCIPQVIYQFYAMPNTPSVMIQCIGMMVGVYAVAYWIAAKDLVRYWPLVLVGLIGKACGPLGLVYGVLTQQMIWRNGLMMLTNDIIWLLPFAIIVKYALTQQKNFISNR